ncbi:hypothetical protein [Bradyrhizobium sp.]|uniref:hypothetical protein n=1 Tax=Bradyrhizobium sp. TaxID=376 RepID=UPI003C5DC08A
MSGSYARNPHHAPDDRSDARELCERREAEAGRWFDDLTRPQRARYDARMAVAAAYKGAPRWDRERRAAEREFAETTKDAARICDMVLRDLTLTGEVSEATSYAFDDCLLRQTLTQTTPETAE